MKNFILFVFMLSAFCVASQPYLQNETYTYKAAIKKYTALAKASTMARLDSAGNTDAGFPLHTFIISKDGAFTPAEALAKNKRVVLINNAIHAGEPCGVDASIKLAEDLLTKTEHSAALKNTVIVIIPVYNIGGALNRNDYSRTGQNGPKEYGFRGNTRNLDLNRDFIKCDSRNAKTFAQVFHFWNPDVFIDTHTTNGADHQYTLTVITSQKDKLHPAISNYVTQHMNPALSEIMKGTGFETIPYVYSLKQTPDDGIKDFLETPRYSSGYVALFNTIGFITEAHKYKPYKDRVEHTYQFLLNVINWTSADSERIKTVRAKANEAVKTQEKFTLLWELDSTKTLDIPFKGYEAQQKNSLVSGEKILFYNHEKPFEKPIKYYNAYKPKLEIEKPKFYVFSQAYEEITERLELNNISFSTLKKDTTIAVEAYYIDDYKTSGKPYENHYLHHSVEVSKETQEILFRKGDILVPVNQKQNRYIIETLEPQAHDSYFAWNFFDNILQQKEWFSPWHFDDEAAELLKTNVALNNSFHEKKRTDTTFAKSHNAQLYYIYQNSHHFEPSYMRYPVYRIK